MGEERIRTIHADWVLWQRQLETWFIWFHHIGHLKLIRQIVYVFLRILELSSYKLYKTLQIWNILLLLLLILFLWITFNGNIIATVTHANKKSVKSGELFASRVFSSWVPYVISCFNLDISMIDLTNLSSLFRIGLPQPLI